MNFVRAMVVGLGVTLAGPALSAEIDLTWFKCDLKGYGRGFSVANPFFFGLNVAEEQAFAMDPMINYYNNQAPAGGTYTKRSANRYRIQYDLMIEFKGSESGIARFDVTFDAKKNSVLMSVDYPGADNQGMGARGKCAAAG